RAVRQERSKPLVAALEGYMRDQFGRLSPKNDVAKAINYMLTRWPSFTRFLDDGRICLSNNAAERGLRCVAVGRRNWTFAGSDEGGRRAAAVYSLTETCMCGWPPWRKGFVGGFDVGSAASMCPAYDWRPQPLALMRSADRVLIKLTRSRRSQVSWLSRSRRSTVASSPPSAPMHHNHPRASEAGDIPKLLDRTRHASAGPMRLSPSCWRALRLQASSAFERSAFRSSSPKSLARGGPTGLPKERP